MNREVWDVLADLVVECDAKRAATEPKENMIRLGFSDASINFVRGYKEAYHAIAAWARGRLQDQLQTTKEGCDEPE